MNPDELNSQYINLATFKKNGDIVKTPVWFVVSDNSIYVVTRQKTGKVKRIKNNPDVKIAPCDFRGNLKGEWTKSQAEIVSGKIADTIIRLRDEKYGFKARLASLFTSRKGDYVVIKLK